MNKRRLWVLLCVAAWITVATIITMNEGYAPDVWLNVIFVRSIPALAFGAVFFCWLRTK